MLTTEQIKAARMLLGWDQVELAKRAGLGVVTVRRIEAHPGVAGGASESVRKIQAALTAAGILLIWEDEQGGEGVRKGR